MSLFLNSLILVNIYDYDAWLTLLPERNHNSDFFSVLLPNPAIPQVSDVCTSFIILKDTTSCCFSGNTVKPLFLAALNFGV